MKRLIIVNGTMGIGKTTVCQLLKNKLPRCVFLDGDWCWNMSPFVVNKETKTMVMRNIHFLLQNFLSCSQYENVLFCWVMHEPEILTEVLNGIDSSTEIRIFSLVCSEKALEERLRRDVEAGLRTKDVIDRSIPRLKNYTSMDTEKIDVSRISAIEAAEKILVRLLNGN